MSALPPPQPLPQMLPASSPPTTTINPLPPNATYYPMPVIYYPTQPISPSIYLQTGQIHQAPMTILLQSKEKKTSFSLLQSNYDFLFLGDNGQY